MGWLLQRKTKNPRGDADLPPPNPLKSRLSPTGAEVSRIAIFTICRAHWLTSIDTLYRSERGNMEIVSPNARGTGVIRDASSRRKKNGNLCEVSDVNLNGAGAVSVSLVFKNVLSYLRMKSLTLSF
jgi:hypothetical protein